MKWGAPPGYLTYAEAAGRLGVSRNHLRQIVFQRKWTVYRPGPRCSVLPAECVEEELKRRGRPRKGVSQMHNEVGWLSILELRGLLRLSPKACRNWLRQHCPREGVKREGGRVYVARWALNQGLRRCTWRPDLHQPRGFQGDPKRRPLNLHSRDSKGRFTSHHAEGSPPRPKQRKRPPLLSATRRYQTKRLRG